jgi:hypothetical protein
MLIDRQIDRCVCVCVCMCVCEIYINYIGDDDDVEQTL